MLPSVSAGSAALTKYAQAVAIAAPEEPPRDTDATPRSEQEAARHNAEKQPVPAQAQDTFARDARATVEAVLELLRVRVLTAMLGLGTTEEIANKAAHAAAAQLASAFAGESRYAAEIVHALLEQTKASPGVHPDRLLQFAARGLVIVIDHETGDVRVSPPRFDLTSNSAPPRTAATPHLLDFTDYSAHQAAPVLQALGAVHAAASAAIDSAIGDVAPRPQAAIPPSAFIVSPDAFVRPLTTQLRAALPDNTITAPAEFARDISRVLAQAIAGVVNAGGASAVSVGEIMSAVRDLRPVTATGDTGSARGSHITLAADGVSVALDTQNGSITVRIGNRVSAFAPVSAAVPGTTIPALPGLDASSLPPADISSRIPAGKVLDEPAGIPFVPPSFDDRPPVIPPVPGQPPAQSSAPTPAA